MTETQVREFLHANIWTFAKSMPKMPHWYIVRSKCIKPELFTDVVEYIQKQGVQQKFGSRIYTYLIIGEWRYWTMGARPDDTIIINRAKNE